MYNYNNNASEDYVYSSKQEKILVAINDFDQRGETSYYYVNPSQYYLLKELRNLDMITLELVGEPEDISKK
jgi:hypothetical protein